MGCNTRAGIDFLLCQVSSGTKAIVRDAVKLYALRQIEVDLSWLMAEELLPVRAGRTVPHLIR